MKGLVPLRWRRVWSVTRWVAVAAVLPLVWACNARTLERPEPNPVRVVNNTFQATLNRKLDILFMVDNSQSMASLQTKLITQFPVFMNVLKALPSGDGSGTGLPDIHVGVISSDTGPGKYDLSDRHCAFGGDQGRFQTLPRLPCATSPLLANQNFLSASMNQQVKNYNGDITDAFSCIAALGDQGCGFEGQLKSVRWALDPLGPASDTNGMFLRAEAFLAVILITNEDDCSVPDDSDLVDPTSQGISNYGPLVSYRCNEFGHLCNINGTLQPPPRTGVINNIPGCVSNEPPATPAGTAPGKLVHVADEVAFLKGLKQDPNQIFVAAITGQVTPYSIGPDPTSPTGDQSVLHSCTQATAGMPEYADPAVRIQQWVEAFGNHGLVQTICAPNFSQSLTAIAKELSTLLGPQCIGNNLVDTNVLTPGIDPQCQMTDQYINDQSKMISTALVSCASNGNTPPCWSLDVDPVKCPGASLILNVNRGPGAMLPNGLSTSVSCAMCIPGVAKAGCPCIATDMVAGCKP
jgi:hypothetical protein